MTDWKKDSRTPEDQASELYPIRGNPIPPDVSHRRIAHVDCIRSEVIPRDELIEQLVEQIDVMRKSLATYGPHPLIDNWTSKLLTKAQAHGYGKAPSQGC